MAWLVLVVAQSYNINAFFFNVYSIQVPPSGTEVLSRDFIFRQGFIFSLVDGFS